MSPEPQPATEASRPRRTALERLRSGVASDLGRLRSISRRRLMIILVVLLVGLAALYVVEPRIDPSVGKPQPEHYIFTPFVISNGGFFAFRDVHLQCVARSVEFAQTVESPKPDVNTSELHVTNVMTTSLRPGQQIAVTCSRGFENEAGKLLHADLDVNICLKPYPLIDYISLVHFRYVGDRGRDDAVHWSEREPRRSSIAWMAIEKESDKQECQWAE